MTPRIELDTRSAEAIDGRQLRAVAFQGVRLQYVEQVLSRLDIPPSGSRALVVGSGRGDLARGLAELGFDVTAVDPSAVAIELAREAADRSGLRIAHQTAAPEHIEHPDPAFDVAYYADTFEITTHLDRVISRAAGALRPGGVLCYDTVNRTVASRLVYLGAFQGLPMTRIMPRGRYSAERLRPPAELVELLSRHGLRNEDICGFKPKNPVNLVRAVLARRRGTITDAEVAPLVDFVLDRHGPPIVTYLGYARRV